MEGWVDMRWDKILEVPRLFSSNLNYLSSSQRSVLFNHIFIFCQEFNEKSRPTFKNNTLPFFKNQLFENPIFSFMSISKMEQVAGTLLIPQLTYPSYAGF
jgi:hypothetical protein